MTKPVAQTAAQRDARLAPPRRRPPRVMHPRLVALLLARRRWRALLEAQEERGVQP